MEAWEALSSDFQTLLLDTTKSDLKLICPGQGEVCVHELIISARSPVFCSMLKSDMSEKQSGTIIIEDFDIGVVKEMVCFMYTSKLDEAFENVKELLVIGDKYEIKSLVEACGKKMAVTISKENVLEIGVFAETFSAKFLLEKCGEFAAEDLSILDNDWQTVVKASPLFLIKILEGLKESKANTGLNVSRFGTPVDSASKWNCGGTHKDAISFSTNCASKLMNIGLFGNSTTNIILVDIEVKKGSVSLLSLKTSYKSNGSTVPIKVPVTVHIEPKTEYTVLATICAPGPDHVTFQGQGGEEEIKFSAEDFKVAFKSSRDSSNNTQVSSGQIPSLEFIL